MAGGGFGGELVARRIGGEEKFACSMRVTTSDNGITNAVEIFRAPQGQVGVVPGRVGGEAKCACSVRVISCDHGVSNAGEIS